MDDNIKLIRGLVINNYKESYPKANVVDIEKYVDELFAFQQFLADKNNVTRQEGVQIFLNLIKSDNEQFVKRNDDKLAKIALIENNLKRGINPTKEEIQDVQPELLSENMKRLALANGYPEDKATAFGISAKILD